MPLRPLTRGHVPPGGAVSAAMSALLRDKTATDRTQQLVAHRRQQQLVRFLQQQQQSYDAVGGGGSARWEIACAALVDAAAHGVSAKGPAVLQAMDICAAAGRSDAVKKIFYSFHRQQRLAKTAEAELCFMRGMATSGDVRAAHERLDYLVRRHRQQQQGRDSHLPQQQQQQQRQRTGGAMSSSAQSASHEALAVTTDLLHAYLTAMLSRPHAVVGARSPPANDESDAEEASEVALRPLASTATDGPNNLTAPMASWAAALRSFVVVRKEMRAHAPLTPSILELVSRLVEAGDSSTRVATDPSTKPLFYSSWAAAVFLVQSAGSQHLLVPPESFDVAIRLSYRHQQHHMVVALVDRMLNSKTPPSEQCVRLALRSAEEVTASRALPALTETMEARSLVPKGVVGQLQTPSSSVRSILSAPLSSMSSTWVTSVRLFQALADNGLALLPQTYEGPIRTCVFAGQWAVAARLVKEMVRCDGRKAPAYIYRSILLSKIENDCHSLTAAEALFESPLLDKANPRTFAALLRCCLRIGDLGGFRRVHREMMRRELPETFDTMKLLMLFASAEGKPHAVVARYVRWMQQTEFERQRIEADMQVGEVEGKKREQGAPSEQTEQRRAAATSATQQIRLHSADFTMEDELLRLVVACCENLQQRREDRDAAVGIAKADALRRLARGAPPQITKPVSTVRHHPSTCDSAERSAGATDWLFSDRFDAKQD